MIQAALALPVITIGEKFLVDKLKAKGVFIYPVSTAFPMKERLRRAILDSKTDYCIAGTDAATKKTQTFLQCFERLYGEPLEPNKGKTRAQSQPA